MEARVYKPAARCRGRLQARGQDKTTANLFGSVSYLPNIEFTIQSQFHLNFVHLCPEVFLAGKLANAQVYLCKDCVIHTTLSYRKTDKRILGVYLYHIFKLEV